MSDRSLIPAPGRRTVLRGSLLASAAIAVPRRSPPPLRSRSRAKPSATWGVQVGDVTASSALVWVRSDRPARMVVETSATESFRRARTWHGPLVDARTDFTGTTPLYGLPAA